MCERFAFVRKHVLLQPMVLSQQKLDLSGLQIGFFSFVGLQFECFFRPSFECTKVKIIETLCKTYGFLVIRRVEVCRKKMVFGAKDVVNTSICKTHIFQGHFQKSSFRLNGSTTFGGSGSETVEKKL